MKSEELMEYYKTNIDGLSIRFADEKDVGLILKFINGLAEYEKMRDLVCATEDTLREWIFEKKKAEVLIGELNGQPVVFALFFYNFSTFLGRAGIYLEDIFVLPEVRGKGIGKAMFKQLCKIASERGYGRIEWCCLDWNEQAIRFYRSIGAEPMGEWTTYRLSKDFIAALGKEEDT